MNSIGNDIIALKATDPARTITPRFYKKFLSPAELDLYHRQFGSLSLHHFVWLAWSVKEAAFKCLQRTQPDLVFSPIKISLIQISAPVKTPVLPQDIPINGFLDDECFLIQLKFEDQTLHTRSIIYGDELIHTVVLFDNDFSDVIWGVEQIESADPGEQSTEVRQFLYSGLHYLLPSADLGISKNATGIPFVLIDGKTVPVSFSHHEKWIGYAF